MNAPASVPAPPVGVSTRTATGPVAVAAGTRAVAVLGESTVTSVAGTPPK